MIIDKSLFPWDNQIPIIENKVSLGARQCRVVRPSLDDVISFLDKYHYQKSCHGQIIRYGLEYDDQLVAVMTFGYPRYKTTCQYELLRLCYNPNYAITGGSNRLFKQFLKDYTPHSIISYCDKSKFTGDVYTKLGFKQISKGNPAKHFWRKSDHKHITMVELLKHGADRLIGTNYGKGTNNEDILLKHGFKIILDKGQDSYLYLDESQYFGYIYCVTDTTNGKQYIGQHIGNVFDENYYGYNNLISRVIKQRKESLKLELLEWCKQDISEREVYYIKHYNTLHPNGYNLTIRPQNFLYERSCGRSEFQKQFAQTKKSKQFYKENGKRLKAFLLQQKEKLIYNNN